MTVTRTPRLGLVRWDADTDPWSREDLVETIDRLEEHAGYSVRAVGAKGDGVTNDAPAIQAAIDAAQPFGAEVIVPDGTYIVANSVDVLAGVTLRLTPGATLRREGTNAAVILRADATITGGRIDGGTGTYIAHISGDRAKVIGVTFVGNGVNGYGIGAGASTDDNLIESCRFENVNSYAVLVENAAARFTIRNNVILNATGGQGVTIKTNTGGSPTDTLIEGNIVDVAGVIGLEVQVRGSSRAVISNNIVRHATIGISLAGADTVTVSGNTITDAATYGIEAAEGTTDSSITGNTVIGGGTGVVVSRGSSAIRPRNIAITGNVLRRVGTYGVNTEFADDIAITGNILEDPSNRAIFVNNGGTGHLIANNRIIRTGDAAVIPYDDHDGIYLSGADHHIDGNLITYAAGLTGWAIYNNGADRLTINGNHVKGGSKAYGIVGGTFHNLTGNYSEGTTQHSVYTSNVGHIFVDGHTAYLATGQDVDLSGATNGKRGIIYSPSVARVYAGFNRHDGSSLGFFNVTSVARAAAAADLKDALVAYGLLTDGAATPLDLDGGALTCGLATVTGLTAADGTLELTGNLAVTGDVTIAGASVATDADLAAHVNDTSAAHAATAIGFTPTGGITATDVAAALAELDTEKAPKAAPTFTGTLTTVGLTASGNVSLGDTAMDLIGFYGVPGVARSAAYNLTGSPDRTLGAYASDPESSVYAGVPADLANAATRAELNQLRAAYENLRTYVEDLAGVTIATATDLKALGLLG